MRWILYKQFRGKFGWCYFTTSQDDAALDDVLQFSDIAGPVVLLQKRQGFGSDADRAADTRGG